MQYRSVASRLQALEQDLHPSLQRAAHGGESVLALGRAEKQQGVDVEGDVAARCPAHARREGHRPVAETDDRAHGARPGGRRPAPGPRRVEVVAAEAEAAGIGNGGALGVGLQAQLLLPGRERGVRRRRPGPVESLEPARGARVGVTLAVVEVLEGKGVLAARPKETRHDPEERSVVPGREHGGALVEGGLRVSRRPPEVAAQVEADEGALILPAGRDHGHVGVLHQEAGPEGNGVPAVDVGRSHGQVAGGGVGGGAHEDEARPGDGRPVEPHGEGALLLERGVESVLRGLQAVGRVPGEARAPGDALFADPQAHLLAPPVLRVCLADHPVGLVAPGPPRPLDVAAEDGPEGAVGLPPANRQPAEARSVVEAEDVLAVERRRGASVGEALEAQLELPGLGQRGERQESQGEGPDREAGPPSGAHYSPRSRALGEKNRSSSFGSSWTVRNSSRVREPSSRRLSMVMRVGRGRPPMGFTCERTSDFEVLAGERVVVGPHRIEGPVGPHPVDDPVVGDGAVLGLELEPIAGFTLHALLPREGRVVVPDQREAKDVGVREVPTAEVLLRPHPDDLLGRGQEEPGALAAPEVRGAPLLRGRRVAHEALLVPLLPSLHLDDALGLARADHRHAQRVGGRLAEDGAVGPAEDGGGVGRRGRDRRADG